MRVLWTCVLMIISLSGFSNETLEKKLRELSGIASFKKIETIGSFKDCYELLILQPINHENPSQGSFLQKIYLSHKDFDQPTVMVINGYISNNNNVNEWSELLEANQIYIEHRYFGQSKPKEIVWETLTLKNVCADLHKIRLLFNDFYPKKWVSTGISKGGLTAVSYKYFYPKDINATIALSASVKTSACDTSFFSYIDSLCVKNGCLQELKDFQRKLLSYRKVLLPLLKEHFDMHNKEYTLLGLDKIFENAVMEIPFSIWQNNSGCETIKNLKTETPEEMFNSMRNALHEWFMTDNVFNDMKAYHYQALTEFGYYCYPSSSFKDLLNEPREIVSFISLFENINISYSNELMLTIKHWLRTCGNNIIYITGNNDPYSIYKIQPNENVNALAIVLENKNHNQVRFKDLNLKQREELLKKIKNWIN
jgi:PS-10 peptidase S37